MRRAGMEEMAKKTLFEKGATVTVCALLSWSAICSCFWLYEYFTSDQKEEKGRGR